MVNNHLGYIDFNKEVIEPVLHLSLPNRTIISVLSEAFDVELLLELGALNELKFKLPIFIENRHNIIKNENVENIRGRYQVKLVLGTYTEYFIIDNIRKVGDDDEQIEVEALSLANELKDTVIRGYEVVSYNAKELLEDMLKDTLWTVGYIDSEFLMKYRKFDVSSSTALECIFNIAETFNALVVFDSERRRVNFYAPENVGTDKGFTISYEKYLESVEQEEESEEIATRLHIYGKDNISIHSVNPMGTSYLENFSYYLYPYEEKINYSKSNISPYDIVQNWDSNVPQSYWSATNEELTLNTTTSSSCIYNYEDMNIKNYKISANFKGLEQSNAFGFVFRYKDEQNYYYVAYDSNGLGYAPNNLKLFKVVNGITTEIANSNSLINGWSLLGGFYNLSVEVDNNLIKVWVDNVLVLYCFDDSHSIGTYGLLSINQKMVVKDFIVNKKEYEIINHSYYMTDKLCHHILDYNRLMEENESVFSNLRNRKTTYEDTKTILENELNDLKTEYNILLDERDVLNTRISKKEDEIDRADNRYQDTKTLKEERDALIRERNEKLDEISYKEQEIDAKENQIVVVESDISTVDNEIELFRVRISLENNFPEPILKERIQYTIGKEWQDSNIEKPEDLLKEGMIVFKEFLKPKLTTSVNIVNFLSMITEQRNWDKLNLGDTFNVEYERLGILDKAKLTSINFKFENNDIDITIANISVYSNRDKYLEMLYKSYSSSTQVAIREWEWNLSRENNGMINQIVNNFWDANKQAVIGAKDQVVEISDRGLLIRDPNNPLVYLVGLNGMIAITNDGGNTWKHAITSEGIVGEYIYGKVFMGVNLAIEDESGILKFQGSKGEIFDRNGTLVMKLGLVDENSVCGEAFGLWSFNTITRVKVDDCEGFVIERANTSEEDGWEKVLWANTDGTLYSHDMVASSIKIVSDKDWNNEILNAETGYFDFAWFNKIVKDGKLTTDEKYQLITELNEIYSGYKLLLSQASKYQRVARDNNVNWDGAFNTSTQSFPTTSSTTDRYSTTALTNAYISLIEYMKTYVGITSIIPHDPLTINNEDPLNETTQEVLPDRATFILKFKTYYDEADKLRHAIEDAIVYQGLSMGSNYNNVYMSDYGFIAVRNDGKYRAYLNATNGLALQKWENNMWVSKLFATLGDPKWEDGTLYAEGLVTKNLRIVDGELGDAIVFDWLDGITIYGQNGEVIRLNANEGIAIDVNNDKRFWVGTDGNLYAKKLIVMDDYDQAIVDQVTGSYISDLTVNKLKTINFNGSQDIVHIEGNYIKLKTYYGASEKTKLNLTFTGTGDSAYPIFIWGEPSGNELGYLYKSNERYAMEYNPPNFQSKFWMNQTDTDDDGQAMLLKTTGGIRLDGQTRVVLKTDVEEYVRTVKGSDVTLKFNDKAVVLNNDMVRIQFNASTYIELNASGVRINGARVDIN